MSGRVSTALVPAAEGDLFSGVTRDAVAALVDVQWRQHELVTSLRSTTRRAVTVRQREALLSATPLPSGFREWSGHTAYTLALYAATDNRARLAWLLSVVGEGERIVDIGPGSGSVGGRLISARRPARYAGIEPSAGKVAAFRGMAAENDIDEGRFELHHATAEKVADDVIGDVQPTLVLLLEVLEHVSDPGGLLALAARSMPGDCDLIVSVPILGRIEHEWGHLSVFDRSRLHALASAAGLTIHWVQPIADQWLFLVLARTAVPRARLARLRACINEGTATATPEAEYFFRHAPLSTEQAILSCPARRAVRRDLLLGPFSVVRLRVEIPPESPPRAVRIELLGGGRPLERWTMSAAALARARPGPATWVFRRGSDTGWHHRRLHPTAVADSLRVTIRAEMVRAARLELARVESVASHGEAHPPIESSILWPPSIRGARKVLRQLYKRLLGLPADVR